MFKKKKEARSFERSREGERHGKNWRNDANFNNILGAHKKVGPLDR